MDLTKEQSERIITTFSGLVERLGFQAEAEIGDVNDGVTLRVTTPEPGRLIGRKGHSLDSLEYLLNRIVSHRYGNDFPRIRIDVDGYEQKAASPDAAKPAKEPPAREKPNKVEQLTLDAAKEVKMWGEQKQLGPFNAKELEMVRNVCNDDPEITIDVQEDSGRDKTRVTVRAVEKKQK